MSSSPPSAPDAEAGAGDFARGDGGSVLSAPVVAAIEDLEFAARLVVEGLRAGHHRSPFHGFSSEFQQHRPYRAGDDLRYLDWKLLARTDRPYSRQFRETTSLKALLLMDASASMGFPPEGISKLRYASILAASLAWLLVTGGDSVGLVAGAGEGTLHLPPRGGRPHLRQVVAALDGLPAAGAWDAPGAVDRAGALLGRRGVLVVLSDLYDREEETRAALRRALQRGHEVVLLQVLSREELDFPFRSEMELEDAETGERRVVDGGRMGGVYRERVAAFLERTREEAFRHGMDHLLAVTDEPPGEVLRRWLVLRERGPGATVGGGPR